MALPDLDTSVGHSFGLEIDGVVIKQIQEVSGLKMEQDVIELKQNTADGKYVNQEAAGPAEGGRDHADPRPHRRQQLREVGQGQPVRQDERRPQGRGDHRLRLRGQRDQALQAENAWPKSLEIGTLKAGDTSVLTEKLVVTYEAWKSASDATVDQRRRRRATAADARAADPDEPQPLRTEFDFVLPRGYVDGSGTVHRAGVMRLATARDELVPLRDDRVRENPAYLTVVLLARVITRIGGVTDIHAGVIEDLFASDLAFLQDLYRRVNSRGPHAGRGGLPVVPARVRRRPRRGSRLGES